MVNFLEKLSGRRPEDDDRRKDLAVRSNYGAPAHSTRGNAPAVRKIAPNGRIPNATKVYAIAATALFVIGIYFLFFKVIVLTGLLILFLSAVLFGYAVFFMRFQT